MKTSTLLAACAVDAVIGDPAGWAHPVRVIGAACANAERFAQAYARGGAVRELRAGLVLSIGLAGGTFLLAQAVLKTAYQIDRRMGFLFESTMAATTLAARCLLDEAHSVIDALERNDLTAARGRLARIVGRDTADLEHAEIARATIETLAESACDGIVAPLLALCLGGIPLALAFKAASTLDSMIGHIEPPYTYVGRASARLDDIACYVPARITAFIIALCAPLAGGDRRAAFEVLRADGRKHRSPNAGRPEAAMAGALGVRLGGMNRYRGTFYLAPMLGAGLATPGVADARRAAALIAVTTAVAATAFIATRGLVGSIARGLGR